MEGGGGGWWWRVVVLAGFSSSSNVEENALEAGTQCGDYHEYELMTKTFISSHNSSMG